MFTKEFHEIISRLRLGIHPITQAPLEAGAVVFQPAVQAHLRDLERLLAKLLEAEEASLASEAAGPTEVEVATLARRLQALGKQLSPTQMARIYRGSRSVIDPELRSMAVFGCYRNLMTEKALVARIKALLSKPGEAPTKKLEEKREEGQPAPTALPRDLPQMQEDSLKAPKEKEEWEEETFFQEAAYDMLSDEQLAAWRQQIAAMELRRQTDRLPAYLRPGRGNYPRAFEPWQAEERALLMEVMCYTNRLDRLVEVFGRSLAALEREGKKLIYKSRQKRA